MPSGVGYRDRVGLEHRRQDTGHPTMRRGAVHTRTARDRCAERRRLPISNWKIPTPRWKGFDAIYFDQGGRPERMEWLPGGVTRGIVERTTVPVTVVRWRWAIPACRRRFAIRRWTWQCSRTGRTNRQRAGPQEFIHPRRRGPYVRSQRWLGRALFGGQGVLVGTLSGPRVRP